MGLTGNHGNDSRKYTLALCTNQNSSMERVTVKLDRLQQNIQERTMFDDTLFANELCLDLNHIHTNFRHETIP